MTRYCIPLLVLLLVPTVAGADDPSFVTRLTVELCPEYQEGGIVFEMSYTVGADPTPLPANIVGQTFDNPNNTTTVDLSFPAFYGTIPFNISSTCRNAKGFSVPSNILSLSNCDVLATKDSDGDGITNNLEDTNCDNFFSPGDVSNPDNVDTDGDGVRDLVETIQGFDPTDPGNSPRPYIYSSAVYDPDEDGQANAAAWRGTTGTWFIRDYEQVGQHLAIVFGTSGDLPFFYQPDGAPSNLGLVRRSGNDYHWHLRGPGFKRDDDSLENVIVFGIFGDNVIPGAWEKPGVTNPAVARLFNNTWSFIIYQSDGSAKIVVWGGNGDIPKPQDFDGDGILDVAVFRPSEQKTYWISSITGFGHINSFGSGTAEHTVRGDFTGDGKEEISVWEPISGIYSSMLSDNGFDDSLTAAKDPNHYFEMQLGLYNVHLPLNWNKRGGILLYTVVDHALGIRYWRENNDPNGAFVTEQWGLPSDHLG